MNIKPTPGYILLEPVAEEKEQTASGIYLPQESKEKPQRAKVIAIGDNPDEQTKCPVQVGDQVIYRKWGGSEVKVGDKDYLFTKFEEILAIIK